MKARQGLARLLIVPVRTYGDVGAAFAATALKPLWRENMTCARSAVQLEVTPWGRDAGNKCHERASDVDAYAARLLVHHQLGLL